MVPFVSITPLPDLLLKQLDKLKLVYRKMKGAFNCVLKDVYLFISPLLIQLLLSRTVSI